MSDSWHHHGRGSSSGNTLVTGILPATKWRFLRHLSLADNAMTAILPTSLAPLSNTLYSLDISSNLFTQIPDSLATLTALRALNLSHCMIDSLQSLTRNPLPAITALNLRGNRLSSLAGVEKLYPLERLDLRDNNLTDPSEIARLTGIPDIREIWVEGNPFTRTHKDYRIAILNLFRKTPGYTEDIIIDGTGPGSNERRYLVERPPVPESVPVVKPKAPEVPTVDVAKPTIVYGSPQSPSSRRERPVPKAVMSEINTGSTRRKKTPKRRIVDLATNDLSAPLPGDVRSTTSPIDRSSAITPEGNYHVAPKPPQASTTSPPAEAYTPSNTAPAAVPRGEQAAAVRPVPQRDSNDPRPSWQSGQSWDSDAQNYRLKIETLRDQVGDGYLSVLGDSDWDSRKSISPGQEDQLAHSLQALQGGRTLGQSVSP